MDIKKQLNFNNPAKKSYFVQSPKNGVFKYAIKAYLSFF